MEPTAEKPFLEKAPWLIAIFSQPYEVRPDGSKMKHYYATESVGIATGFLIAALHLAGLASLTHTPSPMGFLNQLLGRPAHEKPFLFLVVGYPAKDAVVPDIERKPLEEISTFHRRMSAGWILFHAFVGAVLLFVWLNSLANLASR